MAEIEILQDRATELEKSLLREQDDNRIRLSEVNIDLFFRLYLFT